MQQMIDYISLGWLHNIIDVFIYYYLIVLWVRNKDIIAVDSANNPREH